MDLIYICITVVTVVVMLANANIKITITHNYPEQSVQRTPDTGITQEEVDKAYNEHQPNNFDDVIKTINAEFGGVDNGEDTTT